MARMDGDQQIHNRRQHAPRSADHSHAAQRGTERTRMQIPAVIAIVFGLLLSAFNWATLFPNQYDKYVSPIPLFGGLLLAIGFRGFDATRRYWWLAIVIDFGTLTVLAGLPSLIREKWAHTNGNTLYIFENTYDDRTVNIRLFRNADCIIELSFDPPRPSGAQGHFAESADFVGKRNSCGERFEISEYFDGRKLLISQKEEGTYALTETYPTGDEPSTNGLDGIVVNAKRLSTSGCPPCRTASRSNTRDGPLIDCHKKA